ncbi:DEAD/DEAH box helicase [Pseudomonas sp. WC2401]|uniref:DEAD/DEAH box helicase n=1 Tax=Pseudomonas sp. WC2401 TaxID=3234143 RepID=A0AB39X1Y1_9PSED
MDIFASCSKINDLLNLKRDNEARNVLIKLLAHHESNNINYTPLVNHLIRSAGLYPYIQQDTADWQDRFVHEAFKVDTGATEPLTLHREQSILLKALLEGESLAISAPTSFGKSFVIDSFISIKKPNNVVIIVPTIALTDETRRRLYPKFSDTYKIITTTEAVPGKKNIFIFPQERAITYIPKLKEIDILVVDEFYKASEAFDKERSSALIKSIIKLGAMSKQRYFLAPNISKLNENPFTKGMRFISLDFNTVFLEKHSLYEKIENEEQKNTALTKILTETSGKTLIYAGTYADIDRVSNLATRVLDNTESFLLQQFSKWVSKNYSSTWPLVNLINKSTGIHNGQLHRSLSQIQIKLFEEPSGLKNIISTSSIIEGVNTSAENVVIWRNKNGRSKLNDFTYKNIIGRSGRMFKHFIGHVYILEKPPESTDTSLNLILPDALLSDINEQDYKGELSKEQIGKIIAYREELSEIIGISNFDKFQKENSLQCDGAVVKAIATELQENPEYWRGLSYLNSNDTQHWETYLYKIIKFQRGAWDIEYSRFVAFVKILSNNWSKSVPELLSELKKHEIDVNTFFKLEKNTTFKLSSLLKDVNTLQKVIFRKTSLDISPFATKVAHAFLPSIVYQLEEYGLPRMISKKLHKSNVINFETQELTIHQAIDKFNSIGLNNIKRQTENLTFFDIYILGYFFEGIKKNKPNSR